MSDLYILKMEKQLDKELLSELGRYISANKRERMQRLQKVNRGSQILLGDLLLRYVLASYTNEKESDLKFTIDEYGKPSLINRSDIYFNLSHTDRYILLGVDTEPIGVDIEMYAQRNYLGIANIYFNNQEYQYLKGIQEPDVLEQEFFRLWVMKESFLKALGCGFQYPVKELVFQKDKDCYIANNKSEPGYRIQVKQYESDAVYAVCSKTGLAIHRNVVLLENLIHHYFESKNKGI